MDNNNDDGLLQAGNSDDDELTLPRAPINKVIKETLPNMRISNEVRELIVNCCTEFIHQLSSKANEICNAQQKKTMTSEHIIAAIDELGFSDFKPEVLLAAEECKDKRRRQSTRLENLGVPFEELERRQMELINQARQKLAAEDQQQWQEVQMATLSQPMENSDDEDYV